MTKKLNLDSLILFAIFLSQFSNLFIFKSAVADFKIITFLWMFIFGILMIKKLYNKEQLFLNNNANYSKNSSLIFALYITAIILSCLFSIDINRSSKELFQYLYLFFIMYTLYKNTTDINFIEKIVKVMVLSNFFLVTICIFSYITGKAIIPSYIFLPNGLVFVNDNLFSTNTLMESGKEILRLNGVLGLGATGIANLVLIQSLFVNYFLRSVSGNKKILFFLLLLGDLVVMVLTYSRVGILIFVAINLFSIMGKDQVKNFLIIIIAIIICVLCLNIFTDVKERILETFNTQEQSSKYHFAIWIISIKTGFENLISGIGLGNMAFNYDLFDYEFYNFGIAKTTAVNVHNFIIQIWAEQGLIGLLSSCLLIIWPIISYIKTKLLNNWLINSKLYDYIFLAYIATLTYNLTNNNFYIETFWILAGLVYFSKDYTKDYFYEEAANGKSVGNCI